jgi:hypothetical protein
MVKRAGGLWFLALVGIPLWLAHQESVASLASVSCRRPGVVTVMHLLTVVFALATTAAALACARLGWGAHAADGSVRFVGRFGAVVNVTNVVLIVVEGLYIVFLRSC